MSSLGDTQYVEPYTIFRMPDVPGQKPRYMLMLRKHDDLWNSIALCVPVTKIKDQVATAEKISSFTAAVTALPADRLLHTKVRFDDAPKNESGLRTPSDVEVDFNKSFLLDMNAFLKANNRLQRAGTMDDPPSVAVVSKNNSIICNAPLWRRPEGFQAFQELAYPENIVIPANTVYQGALSRITHPQAKAALLEAIEKMRRKVQTVLDSDPNLSIREARDRVIHGMPKTEKTIISTPPLSDEDNEILALIPDTELTPSMPLSELVNRGLLGENFAAQLTDYPSVGSLCASFRSSHKSFSKMDPAVVAAVKRINDAYEAGTLESADPQFA